MFVIKNIENFICFIFGIIRKNKEELLSTLLLSTIGILITTIFSIFLYLSEQKQLIDAAKKEVKNLASTTISRLAKDIYKIEKYLEYEDVSNGKTPKLKLDLIKYYRLGYSRTKQNNLHVIYKQHNDTLYLEKNNKKVSIPIKELLEVVH